MNIPRRQMLRVLVLTGLDVVLNACARCALPLLGLIVSLALAARVHADATRLICPEYPEIAIIQVEPEDIFNSGTQTIQPTSVGKIFYRFFADHYDFLVVYPFFAHDESYSWYTQAQNHAQGIGLSERDISSWFGSDDKLLGVAFVQPGANATLVLHEIGHQWNCYARYCQAGGGLSSSLFQFWQYAPYHWMLVHFGAYGIMGGWEWVDNGDGSFTAGPAPGSRNYLPISLYMMGLISAEELPVIPVLELDSEPGWWQPGDTIWAHVRNIPIEDIICAEGPRIPNVAESQKHFRAAFVVLTMQGIPAGLDYVNGVRRQVPAEFARATGNRASMDTTLCGQYRVYLPSAQQR